MRRRRPRRRRQRDACRMCVICGADLPEGIYDTCSDACHHEWARQRQIEKKRRYLP